jgi:hypothetical protein
MLSLMEFVTPLTLVVLALTLYVLHRKHKKGVVHENRSNHR